MCVPAHYYIIAKKCLESSIFALFNFISLLILCLTISQHRWQDGSPYLYNNYRERDEKDTFLLSTSESISYGIINYLDNFYMAEFKFKLQYVYQFEVSNQSIHHDICTALFLTFFTTPSWVSIGCNDVLPNSYFICERLWTAVQRNTDLYIRSASICPKNTTYIKYNCWKIESDIETRDTISTVPYALQLMLSSWAFGHEERTQITLSTYTKQCLITNDFERHRLKTWSKNNTCELNHYVLTKHKNINYNYVCQGEY